MLSIKFPISQLSPLVINKKLTFSFIKSKNEYEIIRDKVKNLLIKNNQNKLEEYVKLVKELKERINQE